MTFILLHVYDRPMVTNSQSGDGYKCSCGYIADTKSKFLLHLGQSTKRDGKGVHQSEGRVNLQTGEITMPPWNQRTRAQKDESSYGKRAQKLTSDGKVVNVRTTDILAQASEIKFVPRIFTCTFTPIMQAALTASVNVFRWRSNMPFENFLDTVLYYYFMEHGVQLAGYIVDDNIVNQTISDDKGNGHSTDKVQPFVEIATNDGTDEIDDNEGEDNGS